MGPAYSNLVNILRLSLTSLVIAAASALAQHPDPLVIAPDANSATFTYTGTTVGGPLWRRPVANGNNPPTGLSGLATAVPYSVISFTVTLTGSYVFQSVATAPLNWDNYTFLYVNSFNPAAALTNVVIGNDDNPSIGLSGFTTNLTAGLTYFFVTTGFSNSSSGAFSNTIEGPGNINVSNAVPESGVNLALFASVVAGLFAVRSLRRRAAGVA